MAIKSILSHRRMLRVRKSSSDPSGSSYLQLANVTIALAEYHINQTELDIARMQSDNHNGELDGRFEQMKAFVASTRSRIDDLEKKKKELFPCND